MVIGTRTVCDTVQRMASMKEVLVIQQAITKAARESLEKFGFLEIIPPVLVDVTDPGLRGAERFEVDFYGKKYKLTSSMMLQKISAASAVGKVFALSPCFRKEQIDASETGRHLSEFWQIDVEMQGERDLAMTIAETMLRDVIQTVVETKAEELKSIGRTLKIPELPFKRFSHAQAVKLSKELGYETDEDGEISWEAEKAISEHVGGPFFVMDYPIGSRGFYDKTVYRKQLGFDLIYPEGFGEAVSGSEREIDAERVIEKLVRIGEDPKEYKWFIELIEKGSIKQTAGFGFGLERLTKYVCGLARIEDATPFPKSPGGDVL